MLLPPLAASRFSLCSRYAICAAIIILPCCYNLLIYAVTLLMPLLMLDAAIRRFMPYYAAMLCCHAELPRLLYAIFRRFSPDAAAIYAADAA